MSDNSFISDNFVRTSLRTTSARLGVKCPRPIMPIVDPSAVYFLACTVRHMHMAKLRDPKLRETIPETAGDNKNSSCLTSTIWPKTGSGVTFNFDLLVGAR